MNEDLGTINDWMGDNRLIVNSNKSYYMFFGIESKIITIDIKNIQILMNQNSFKEFTSIKYLRIKI